MRSFPRPCGLDSGRTEDREEGKGEERVLRPGESRSWERPFGAVHFGCAATLRADKLPRDCRWLSLC